MTCVALVLFLLHISTEQYQDSWFSNNKTPQPRVLHTAWVCHLSTGRMGIRGGVEQFSLGTGCLFILWWVPEILKSQAGSHSQTCVTYCWRHSSEMCF